MENLPMDELIKKVGGAYKLVVLAAKRALELNEGKEKLVDVNPHTKPAEIALKEILEGKVTYKAIEEQEGQKKKSEKK